MIKHWIRLPKEVESPSVEKFKTQLDRALDNLGPAFIRGLKPEGVQSSLVGWAFSWLCDCFDYEKELLWHQWVNRKHLCERFHRLIKCFQLIFFLSAWKIKNLSSHNIWCQKTVNINHRKSDSSNAETMFGTYWAGIEGNKKSCWSSRELSL